MPDPSGGYFDRLAREPVKELGRWARFLRFQVQLWRLCAHRLRANNVMAMSAALSFRTIFALVPILVLGFLMLKSVGALEASKVQLRQLLATSGFEQITIHREEQSEPEDRMSPTEATSDPTQIDVASEIEKLVTKVEQKLTLGRIGPVGVVLLVWSAMTLVGTIERSLNRIFGVRQSRSFRRRMLFHWSAVTLGPLLLAGASYAGGRLGGLSTELPVLSWLLAVVGWIGPIIVGMMFVAALYKLMPNAQVQTRAALGGALLAVPLWLIAKWAFAIYVQQLVVNGNIYGTIGLLPLFLVWLNFSWWIFLFGAQLAHAAANLEQLQSSDLAGTIQLGPVDMLAVALAVAQNYATGKGPVGFNQLRGATTLPGESIGTILDRLEDRGILCLVGSGDSAVYVPSRPLGQISVLEVMGISELPRSATPEARFDGAIADRVQHLLRQAQGALGALSLADLLAADSAVESVPPAPPRSRDKIADPRVEAEG